MRAIARASCQDLKKLRFHRNISRDIPNEAAVSFYTINVLPILVFRTKSKQLNAAVSLENIMGRILQVILSENMAQN